MTEISKEIQQTPEAHELIPNTLEAPGMEDIAKADLAAREKGRTAVASATKTVENAQMLT